MNVLILKEEFHMDALKIMTEGMVKEEQPVLNIGDTVRGCRKSFPGQLPERDQGHGRSLR